MGQHRIKELREAKGWSQEALATRVGRSKWVISRIESGDTGLDLDMANKIATALGASIADVLGLDVAEARGVAEDGTPYTATGPSPFAAFITSDQHFVVVVTSDVVDLAGAPKGSHLLINEHPDACRAVKPLDLVWVMYHRPGKAGALSLLRQFVPPRLLITNSSTSNERNIDMGVESATIIGVVERIFRDLRN